MSEIVYTETDERRGDIAVMDHGRRLADVKWSLFHSRDKVAAVCSRLIVGVPRGHQTKRYYYWKSVESFGFRRNAAGTILPYQCSRPWDATREINWRHRQARLPFQVMTNEPSDDADISERLSNEFRRAVWLSFDITEPHHLFPMMSEYDINRYWLVPNNLHDAFRADSWGEYAARAFGKTRVTPRLEAAVKQTEPYFVAYARNFRGLVEHDKMVAFMERNHFDDELEEGFHPHTPEFRAALLASSQETRDGLIDATIDLSETIRIRNVCGRNVRDFHSKFVASLFSKGTTWTDINGW